MARPAPARWPRESGVCPAAGSRGAPLALPRASCGGPAEPRFFSRGGEAGLEAPGPPRPRPTGRRGGQESGLGNGSGRLRAQRPLAPVAFSRVRVFFGKLRLFSSLVSASPERGRVGTGARAALDLRRGRGRRPERRGVPGRGRLAWGRWGVMRRESGLGPFAR